MFLMAEANLRNLVSMILRCLLITKSRVGLRGLVWGKFLGLVHIQRSMARLAGKDHKTQPSSRLKGGSVASDDQIQKKVLTKKNYR